MNVITNKQHALIALTSFADSCRAQLAGKPEQIAQVDALVAKADTLSIEWYDAHGASLHTGHGSNVADGRAVAQSVAKA